MAGGGGVTAEVVALTGAVPVEVPPLLTAARMKYQVVEAVRLVSWKVVPVRFWAMAFDAEGVNPAVVLP